MISGSLHPCFNMNVLRHLKCTSLEANTNALACVFVCVYGGVVGGWMCNAHTTQFIYYGLYGVCYVHCVQCVVCKLRTVIGHTQLAVFTASSL